MIVSQKEACIQSKKLKNKNENKTVALVIGFYDMISIRHIKLFKFAKQHADFLLVGVEKDESAKINISGGTRPIDKLTHRLEMINELKSVDFVFSMDHVVDFKNTNASLVYKELFSKISPTCLVTNITTDKFALKKEQFAKELGIRFVASTDTSHLE